MENKPSKEQIARIEKIREDFIKSPLFKNVQQVAKEYNKQIERIQKLLAPSLEQINNLKKQMEEKRESENPILFYQRPIEYDILDELKKLNQKNNQPKNENPRLSYKLPDGASWERLVIKFFDGHTVKVTYDNLKTQTFNYKDMGFIDRKTNNPDTKWKFLIAIAENGGSLTNLKYDKRFNRNVKYLVNKRLKEFFGMNEDPIFCYTKKIGYKPLFTILPEK